MVNINWATMQPLTGGMPIGYEQEFGNMPKFIIDNSGANTSEYINYCKQRGYDIPVIKMNWDVTEFLSEEDEIIFNSVKGDIDVMCYVPICSGLSMLNNCTSGCNARGDADNNQNQNMYNLSTFILDKIKPTVACFENAPNAYSPSGKGVLDNLIEIGMKHNYTLSIEKVDTYDHGIPQHRQRTFIYYWNSEKAPYIEYQKQESPNLIDFFNSIPAGLKDSDTYCTTSNSIEDYTYECINELYNPQNKHIIDAVLDINPAPKNTSGLGFLNDTGFDKPIEWANNKINYFSTQKDEENVKKYEKVLKKFIHCKTKREKDMSFWDATVSIVTHRQYINALIGKNISVILHPTENRCLNIRELLSLMGMPYDYSLTTNKNYMMITQNVPVCTARHSAFNCRKFVLKELKESNSTFVKQNNIKQTIDFENNNVVDNW